MFQLNVNLIFINCVEFYQRFISAYRLNCCRFSPTCSTYAIIALEKYSWYKAVFLILCRILRCAPWNKGGYDPVPESLDLEKRKVIYHES